MSPLKHHAIVADLSNNNGTVDLHAMANAGVVSGFWHKVSEGSSFTDRYYTDRATRGRALGLHVGGYHFARPDVSASDESAVREADHFCTCLGSHGSGDLRPALDLEVGTPHGPYVRWARVFNQRVLSRIGVLPLFYSYPAYIDGLAPSKPIGEGLWLASYGRDDGLEHPYRVPKPWKHVSAHQFTSRAHLAGVAGWCDLSVILQPAAVVIP